MRNLFIVLAKVVGLLQIPTILTYLYFLNNYLTEVVLSGDWIEGLRNHFMGLFATCVCMALFIALAWAFLLRTTWIADRLGLPEGEMAWPETNLLLYVGIKLLGLWVLVGAIPGFISVMISPRAFDPDSSASHFWIRIVPSVIKFIFGLILVGKTKYVIELISGDSKPKEEPSV